MQNLCLSETGDLTSCSNLKRNGIKVPERDIKVSH